MKLSSFLLDVGRPVAYHPKLKKITGSTTATILLCQFIYWRGKEDSKADGWLYKDSEEIEEETGLTYNEQRTARKKLVELNIMEEKYNRLDHNIKFKLNLDEIDHLWNIEMGNSETCDSPTAQSTDGHLDNVPLANSELYSSLNRNTETTSETTSDITSLSQKFEVLTGILFHKNQEWQKSIHEMVQNGVDGDILEQAYHQLTTDRKNKGMAPFTVAGPWSLQNTAISIAAEKRKSEKVDDKIKYEEYQDENGEWKYRQIGENNES